MNWRSIPFARTPRYSRTVSWKGAYFGGTPKYSSYKHRFDIHKKYQQQTRPYNPWIAQYSGFIKNKKPHFKNMHPSVNYLTAKNISSKAIKKGLRKWNIFWVRLNPNKVHPPGTRKVAKKAKFDRREKDIWNNGQDKKPNTRNDTISGAEESSKLEEGGKNKK